MSKGLGNPTAYAISNEDMAALFERVQAWAQERNIDNPAVAAQAMRHVAGIVERTAAQAGYVAHMVKERSE